MADKLKLMLVDDHYLEVGIRLAVERVKQPHDGGRAVACGDHDREEVTGGEHAASKAGRTVRS